MTRDTRSDLLFAALATTVTYGLAGPVPAAVVAVVALLVSVGWRGPVYLLRRGAAAAWDGLRGGLTSVPAVRGASVGVRWLVVVFLAGLMVGRGGLALPTITLPEINWPTITLPDVVTPEPPAPKATGATYVYEKDEHAVPSFVASALNKINRDRGYVIATTLEADPQDGTGDVPDQYKVPLAAAKEAGLPAFVVTAGDEVLRVVKDPKDANAMIEAVK